MEISSLHQLFLRHPNAFTDSRNCIENGIYFALKGPNFNGNTFAREVLEKGAAYAVVDDAAHAGQERTILVDNVLNTLQELATYHRNYCKAKVISLTGSNGKTTTKELIYAVLSTTYSTIATKGNLNNHIGVPLSLLTIAPETEMAIIEMGANHQKEIAMLSAISQPDYGYITNFGKAHLEGFGGVEGVIKGKSELYDYLMDNNRYAFLNADDAIQKEKLSSHIKKIGFSQTDHEYYNIRMIASEPYVSLSFEGQTINTQLVGHYNFTNCAIAVLVGKYFNVPIDAIKSAIEGYVPENNRSQLIKKQGYEILLDAYNANPTSMKAALESFQKNTANTKILFLGDMFELGEEAEKEHQYIAELAKELGFDEVYLVGENFYKTTSQYPKFKTFEDLKAHLGTSKIPSSSILIKGSRGMALERILDSIYS
ncbi:UDP-N-acetylmuramoyl-tripeptide-D-alanyl-D-alanine ligase [Croceitalea dokdonensis DOKDO 023]|uniref:UDP-N-acetylmuramoyl-tripeptide--D-alanyl-D-alanine ligase n=1 Tax=Croceitalea dokdonensis DOKDO 023 TaxID=1300341 RepID=A0A0P7AX21_9FLAO|nr:UDP-N-acetylmuramoyl-tripeptide--D-alanyl-D-alanine ligase [Croceitalea dokdonensis]KPM32583.1 UDP-N-acetylmuramoyl-tripeptide-D-alanyl-D-alanine ligase [Croceitalea dokdonensis DOKDO 023]